MQTDQNWLPVCWARRIIKRFASSQYIPRPQYIYLVILIASVVWFFWTLNCFEKSVDLVLVDVMNIRSWMKFEHVSFCAVLVWLNIGRLTWEHNIKTSSLTRQTSPGTCFPDDGWRSTNICRCVWSQVWWEVHDHCIYCRRGIIIIFIYDFHPSSYLFLDTDGAAIIDTLKHSLVKDTYLRALNACLPYRASR